MEIMIHAENFSLKHTIDGGQPLAFYADMKLEKVFEGLGYVTERGKIDVSYSKRNNIIEFGFTGDYSSKSASEDIVKRLGINHDMKSVYSNINTDGFMAKAISGCYGMRVTKSSPWEATLCFLISQFNNIKRIRHIMLRMIEKFGEEREGSRLFPSSGALASADLAYIRKCGTGFRDKYIKSVAAEFENNFDAERLYRLKYEVAKDKLMELDGIGDKVADCILLFGYGKFESFPIDVWIKRVIEKEYFKGRKKSIRQIHEFSIEKWGRYRGYAQQYIYEFGRRNKV